jgi:hypothetical protein
MTWQRQKQAKCQNRTDHAQIWITDHALKITPSGDTSNSNRARTKNGSAQEHTAVEISPVSRKPLQDIS